MTRFLLLRHASHDLLGRVLAGRMPGVHINARGRGEVLGLCERLRGAGIDAIVTSPLERAVETATPLGETLGLTPEIEPALTEMAFGEWTGLTFEELEGLAGWKAFNACRSTAPVPSGETMLQTQARAVQALVRIRSVLPDGATVAIVSHGDVLRALVAYHLGLPIDFLHRFEIEPASITTLHVADHGATLLRLNEPAVPGPAVAPEVLGRAAMAETNEVSKRP